LAPRPQRFVDGVIRAEAACDPRDVLANRLDPWHGAHFHAHSFASLVVTRAAVDRLEMRVAYRVAGPLVVEVDASFHCPTARSIVMTIIDGDGAGSVVETHATPMAPGRTAVVEATLATSDRPGFAVARRLAPLLRPFVEARAQRLWDDDLGYAEQTYQLRVAGEGAPDHAALGPTRETRPVRKARPVRDAGAGPRG
jgi:isorenieratene synthase